MELREDFGKLEAIKIINFFSVRNNNSGNEVPNLNGGTCNFPQSSRKSIFSYVFILAFLPT